MDEITAEKSFQIYLTIDVLIHLYDLMLLKCRKWKNEVGIEIYRDLFLGRSTEIYFNADLQ